MKLCQLSQSLLLSAILMLSASLTSRAETLAINGITEAFLDVTLSAPVSGIIRGEFFKEGDAVKKGDVILELDKSLEELEVARRKAVMDKTKTDLEATRVLVTTTKSVSKDELAKKETEAAVATAEHSIAVEELARRRITAPFGGAIAEISLHAGAACAPYQSLVRVVDTTRCFFIGHVEGKAAANLKSDQVVKIHVDGGVVVPARIAFISPVVDPASGLAKVKAIFENAEGKVRPGLTAKLVTE